MLTSLGSAALLGIVGTLLAVVWGTIVRYAGTPAALLAEAGAQRERRWWISTGTALAFLVEAYLILAFGALVTWWIRGFLAERPEVPGWPLWAVGWYLASAPVLFAGKDPGSSAVRDAQDTAFNLALPVAGVGYWVFVFWPKVAAAGWPWLPW